MTGYVYFIQINGMQPIKIGYTTDPKGTDRFDSAKTYAPFGVTYVANIPSSNAAKLEKELHQRFADKRLNGEWFDISQADAYRIAIDHGGNAGAPTLDFEFFIKEKDYGQNFNDWYETIKDKEFKRQELYLTHSNPVKFGISKNILTKLLSDKSLFIKTKHGHYIKTQLQ